MHLTKRQVAGLEKCQRMAVGVHESRIPSSGASVIGVTISTHSPANFSSTNSMRPSARWKTTIGILISVFETGYSWIFQKRSTNEDIRGLNTHLYTLKRKVADAHLVKDGAEITALPSVIQFRRPYP